MTTRSARSEEELADDRKTAMGRVVKVLALYLVVGWLVLGLAGWLRRVLALPGLFDALVRYGMVAGLPVALVLAWHYPKLARGQDPSSAGRSPDGS